mmetsp:Transcript_10740/g.21356  ORF Transcript_10740/g.21356 Transcript_10740/m.21356 type:complete len:531 (-) Transcript_10740:173-1765(-)
MKFTFAASIVALLSTIRATAAQCSPDPLEYIEEIGMKVEKVGSIPNPNTDAFSYNLAVSDTHQKSGKLFFLNQMLGQIYSYDNATVKKIWDMEENEIPSGLDLGFYGPAGQTFKVHNILEGVFTEEIIVVFTSATLPTGWLEPDAPLPAPGAYPGHVCKFPHTTFVRDIYRMGVLPLCVNNYGGFPTYTIYNVFYKFHIDESGQLANNPTPFFVLENQLSPGHLGGGALALEGGKILWSVGDCTIFGFDGNYAPQSDDQTCGKILLIDSTEVGSFEIAAKGVRNSQQMSVIEGQMEVGVTTTRKLKKKKGIKGKKKGGQTSTHPPTGQTSTNPHTLVFMDIGGVTAEEVNAVSMEDILDTSTIENFGWGRNQIDGKTREGTFYIAPGYGGVLGDQPACEKRIFSPEEGYIHPWIQFGRTPQDFYYGIISFVISDESFDKLSLVWTEFNTGNVLGTTESYSSDGPSKGYKINLYDADMTPLPMGFNDLVKEELGEVGYFRGDPRLFHYPDGTAGVFIERTGVFYKLTEIEI